MISLDDLIVPQTKDQMLEVLLEAMQGVGQIFQVGVDGAPPLGTGDLVVAGSPLQAYDVLIAIVDGGSTSTLGIQWSLDGGKSWSSTPGTATQSSGGSSPWVMQLLDYRASNAPTGLTLTFSDGYAPITGSWIAGESYGFATAVPTYSLTDFYTGSDQRTLLEADAQVDADFSTMISTVTAGGFTGLATLPWLQLLAFQIYGLMPKLALPTIGQVELNDGGGAGPFTLQPGQPIVQAESGNVYQGAVSAPAVVPKLHSIRMLVQASNPGSGYNDPSDELTSLITSLPGVSVINVLGSNLGAAPWLATTGYLAGALVRPPGGNAFVYGAQTGGTSSAVLPAFPTSIGQTVNDNGITWVCYGVDTAANSYVQSGQGAAPGAAFAQQNGVISEVASIVVQMSTGGFCGSAQITVSVDGGLTFGAPITLPQMNGLTAAAGILPNWAPNTVTALDAEVYPLTKNGFFFEATDIGAGPHQTGGAEPAWPANVGGTVVDGDITWTNVGAGRAILTIDGVGAVPVPVASGADPNLAGTVWLGFIDGAGGSFGNPAQAAAFYPNDVYTWTTDWATQYGSDAETAAQLALRCQQQWPSLAMGFPIPEIEGWAKKASDEVVIASASIDPAGTGVINLFVASASGPVSAAGLAAVEQYVSPRLGAVSLGLNGVPTGLAYTVQSQEITLSGTITFTGSSQAAVNQQLAAALNAYALIIGVGNEQGTVVIRYSQLLAILQGLPGVTNNQGYVEAFTADGGAVDIVLNSGYLASFNLAGLNLVQA